MIHTLPFDSLVAPSVSWFNPENVWVTAYAPEARPPLYLFKRETSLDFSRVYPATPCAAALCVLTH